MNFSVIGSRKVRRILKFRDLPRLTSWLSLSAEIHSDFRYTTSVSLFFTIICSWKQCCQVSDLKIIRFVKVTVYLLQLMETSNCLCIGLARLTDKSWTFEKIENFQHISNFMKYARGTLEVTTLIFSSHSGNTEVAKFCTCARIVTPVCTKVLSEFSEFYTCLFCIMMFPIARCKVLLILESKFIVVYALLMEKRM